MDSQRRRSADPRLQPMLDSVEKGTTAAIGWLGRQRDATDERAISGKWAGDLEIDVEGVYEDVIWAVHAEVVPQSIEEGRAAVRPGGLDIFVEVDVLLSPPPRAVNVHKGILIQAKRLDELESKKPKRKKLREQCDDMLANSQLGSWVVIYDRAEFRVVRARSARRIIPADGGEGDDASALWRAGTTARSLFEDAIDCKTGDPERSQWTDLRGELRPDLALRAVAIDASSRGRFLRSR